MQKKVDNVNRSGEAADDDVLELVHAVMHDYRSLQYRALRDGPYEITHMDAKVLGYFARHPGATQSDLAQYSGRDKAQLARLIKGLRERGLLDGVADENDRRNLRLTPTDEGRAIHKSLRSQARRLGVRAVDGLQQHEQEQLVSLLRRVKANLERDS